MSRKCCKRRSSIRSGPTARDARRNIELTHPGKRYGVGFACVQKDFGTGAETSFAKVELAADGRIALLSHRRPRSVPACRPRRRSRVRSGSASRPPTCTPSVTDWPDLPVVTQRRSVHHVARPSRTSCRRIRAGRRLMCRLRARRNSAFYFTHTHARSGARRLRARPVAGGDVDLEPRASAAARRRRSSCGSKMRAGSTASSPPPVSSRCRSNSWRRQAHELGLVTGAAVHGSTAGNGARRISRSPARCERLPLDGLALRYGDRRGCREDARAVTRCSIASACSFRPSQRNNAAVTYYSAVGTLVELAVHGQRQGRTAYAIIRSWSAATRSRRNSSRASCRAAWRWASAMRCTSSCRSTKTARATARWNFNRYQLPRASRCRGVEPDRRNPAAADRNRSAEGHCRSDDDPGRRRHRERSSRTRSAIASPTCRSRLKIFRRPSHDPF